MSLFYSYIYKVTFSAIQIGLFRLGSLWDFLFWYSRILSAVFRVSESTLFCSEQLPASLIFILSTVLQLLIYPHVEKIRIFRKAVHTQPANFLFLKSVFCLSFTNSGLRIWILIFRNNLLLKGNKNEVRKPVFCDNSWGFGTSWFPILYILLIMDPC